MELSNKRKNELIDFCRQLIKQPSLTGLENKVAKLIFERMEKLNFDEVWINEQGSVIGKIKGSGNGKTVLLDGHMDTVDVSDPLKWTHDPFGAEIENDRIYGRGAADMKGSLAAMVMAAGWLAEDQVVTGDIYITGTAMEEIAEGYSLDFILRNCSPDIVVIGEATELNLNIGQRGRGEITLRTYGKTAHSSNPEVGINAVKQMILLLNRINELPVAENDDLGKGILELVDIISSPYPGKSVVPDLCTVTFDRRLLVGETEEIIIGPIKRAIDELKETDPNFDADVSIADINLEFYTGFTDKHVKFAPAWFLDVQANEELIQNSLAALRAAGLNSKLSKYNFCTNGSASAGIHQIPTIGFGPCAESQAHVIDEYIEISQLVDAAKGYYKLMQTLAM